MNGFNRDQNVGRITPAPFHPANEKAPTGIRRSIWWLPRSRSLVVADSIAPNSQAHRGLKEARLAGHVTGLPRLRRTLVRHAPRAAPDTLWEFSYFQKEAPIRGASRSSCETTQAGSLILDLRASPSVYARPEVRGKGRPALIERCRASS